MPFYVVNTPQGHVRHVVYMPCYVDNMPLGLIRHVAYKPHYVVSAAPLAPNPNKSVLLYNKRVDYSFVIQ